MGIFDLPDVNDDDWNAYQADSFRRISQPQADALAFQQSIGAQVDDTFKRIMQLAAPQPQPAPPPQPAQPMPPVQQMSMPGGQGDGLFSGGGLFGGGGQPQPTQQQQVDPASLSTMLSQYPDEDGLPGTTGTTSPPVDGLGGFPSGSSPRPQQPLSQPIGPQGPPGPPDPGFWSGAAPEKPNIFSWIGGEAQRGADALRATGATQVPVIGGLAGGVAQASANAFNNLGGSVEALRQGNVPGALGGALQATVGENSPLGWGKDIATELQAPKQIFPGIDPETPFLGGLNNPRELAGLAPQLIAPETALERGVMGAAGKVLGPVARGVGEAVRPAAERIGEVASPYVDNILGSIGRGAEQQPAFGMTVGEGGAEAFHGSGAPYERVDPSKFDPDGLYGPGYYKTTSPEVAESYSGELRGGSQYSGTVADWSQDLNRVIDDAAARGIPGAAPASTFQPNTYLGAALQGVKEDFAPTGVYGRSSAYLDDWHRSVTDTLRDAFSADIVSVDEALSTGRLGQVEAERIWRELDDSKNHFYDSLDAIEKKYTPVAEPNIRKVNVPEGAQYLDVNKTLPINEWQQIQNELRRKVEVGDLHPDDLAEFGARVSDEQRRRFINASPEWMRTPGFNDLLGEDYYQALRRTFADKAGANKFLSDAGFDGVTHEGGRIMPLRNAAGQPITHQVYVTFPEQIGKLTNAVSGVPGGIVQGAGEGAMRALQSPFFSPARTGGEVGADLALGAAGGVAGAATAPEDATWQERLQRGAAGAALASGIGPMARAPGGIGGLARNLLRDETGALNLGVLNPPEGYADDEWRAMSRNERRRINYQQGRGEYAKRSVQDATDAVGDYGAAEPTPPHTSDAPDHAQQAAYEETMSRMTERGVPEDDADATAYTVGKDAAGDEAEKISDEAARIYDEEPDLRPNEDADGDGISPQQEIDSLTDGVTYALRQNPITRGKQEQFIGQQEGLLGIQGPEYRASEAGAATKPAYDESGNFTGYAETVGGRDPQAVMKAIADRTGSAPIGTQVTRTLADAGIDADTMFNPDEAVSGPLPKVEAGIKRGEQMLAGETPEVRGYVDRVVAGLQDLFTTAHGKRTDPALREAVDALRPYALDLARSADPKTGMTSDVLVALMHKGVEATTTPTYIAYDRLQQLIMQGAPDAAVAAARKDYEARAAVNNVYLAGLEVYRSAAGRALRANQPGVYGSEAFLPNVGGASGVDAGDVGRSKNFGKAEPAQEASAVARDEWNTRQRALRRGEPVVDRGADWDSAYWQRKRDLGQAANPQRSGRRINGPLENEGLMWTDVFVRDNPAGPKDAPLTEGERMRWLFGLAEVGVEKGDVMDALYKRMAVINPNDQDAVMKFWADAAREGGARDISVKVERPNKRDPNRMVAVYEKVRQAESPWEDGIKEAGRLADTHPMPWMRAGKLDTTLPRDKAVKVAYNALKKRYDDGVEALAEAHRDGIGGDIKRYEQVVAAAKKNLPVDEGGTARGLYERFKTEYPPDFETTRMPGERRAENVNVQSPEILTRKVELLSQLDEMGRGISAVRGGLSIVTSNMLTSARMIEASAMESGMTAINKVYTQAVWRGDTEGAKQILSGYLMGAVPAWNNMLYAFKHGMGPMEAMDYLNDVTAKGAPAIRSTPLSTEMRSGVQAGWLAPMHRISRAMQEYFNTMVYYGELNRLANVQVRDLTKANAAARSIGSESRGRVFAGDATRVAANQDPLTAATWFKAPTEEMRNAALKEAMTIASGGPHSALAKTLAGIKSNLEKSTTPGGKALGLIANVIFPFVYGIDFTVRAGTKLATGPIVYPLKAGEAALRGDAKMAKAYATNAGLTTAVDTFLVAQVLGGNLTGKGPSDPRERQALLESTDEAGDPIWRPDSMRVPLPNGRHMWMAYGSLPIVGLTGAIFANAYDMYMYDGKTDDAIAAKVAKAAAGVVGTVAEGTYFRDMMDLVSIFSEPQRADTALSRFAGGLVGRLIPAAVRQTAQAIDPNRKAPENALQELGQNIPGVRNLIPNQVSPFTGGDVRMGWSPASLVAPGAVYYGSDGTNPLATETDRLNRLGFNANPSQYSASQQGHGTAILGQRQSGEQVRGAQSAMADETRRRADALTGSAQYRGMSDAQKAAALDAVYSRAREASSYEWQQGLDLTPKQELTRELGAVRKYVGPGLSGLPPEQLARRNQEIGQAKSLLSQLEQAYGPGRGEIALRRISQQAWRDAVMYEDVDPDLRWMRERRVAQGLGLDPRAFAQPGAADEQPAPLGAGLFGNTGGVSPTLMQPPDYSYAGRFPPSMRR
jgi:hypothetical protein